MPTECEIRWIVISGKSGMNGVERVGVQCVIFDAQLVVDA